jgi:hypothetical protein
MVDPNCRHARSCDQPRPCRRFRQRAQALPLRRRNRHPPFSQLPSRPHKSPTAQPGGLGRRRLGRLSNGVAVRRPSRRCRRVHIAAALGACQHRWDAPAVARSVRIRGVGPSLRIVEGARSGIHRLSPTGRRAGDQSERRPHDSQHLRGLCIARLPRLCRLFRRLRRGHEEAQRKRVPQHGGRRARAATSHGTGQHSRPSAPRPAAPRIIARPMAAGSVIPSRSPRISIAPTNGLSRSEGLSILEASRCRASA